MSYIDLINAFEKWLESNSLPVPSQLMFYKFLVFFNRAGWAAWVQVDNRRVMYAMQMTDEKTMIRHRDKLVNAGLIEYKRGKKGSPNSYHLNLSAFTGKMPAKSENTGVFTGINTGPFPGTNTGKSPSHKRLRLRQEDISDEISSAHAREDGRNSVAELARTFESLVGPITQKAKRGLAQAAKELGCERVEEAIFIAADNGATCWDYVAKTIATLRLHPEVRWESP